MVHSSKKKILIIDDSKVDVRILVDTLKNEYQAGVARNGQEGLRYVKRTLPDLILLDVMMPGMSGYEVCTRLKSDSIAKDIPIIFITAMDEIEDKTKGFELGAVDYITKPFDAQEVRARVKTHLTIREQELQIKKYASQLENMVEERTRQLIHADRLATMGILAAAIAHEIGSPITYISGNAKHMKNILENMKGFCTQANSYMEGQGGESLLKTAMGQIEKMEIELEEMIESILEASYSISRLTRNLGKYCRPDDIRKERCFLLDVINEAVNLLSHRLKYGISLEVSASPDLEVDCDPQRLSQVFVNLLNNSIDVCETSKGQIAIEAEILDKELLIRVRDNGPGISNETASNIFDPFFTTKDADQGTGLGLFVVRRIIEEHSGRVFLSSSEGTGAEFSIVLPLRDEKSQRMITHKSIRREVNLATRKHLSS